MMARTSASTNDGAFAGRATVAHPIQVTRNSNAFKYVPGFVYILILYVASWLRGREAFTQTREKTRRLMHEANGSPTLGYPLATLSVCLVTAKPTARVEHLGGHLKGAGRLIYWDCRRLSRRCALIWVASRATARR